MKNYTFTRLAIVIALLLSSFSNAFAQYKSTWSGNIIVNPDQDKQYKFARVTVAFDGTIYLGRVYKWVNPHYDSYEILKSTDNGQTFTVFYETTLGPTDVGYTAFDIVAAGENAVDFKLFVASAYLYDNGDANIKLAAINSVGTVSNIALDGAPFNYTPTRGWEALSIASDAKVPNSSSNPYGIILAAVKANIADSIVVWMDHEAGNNLTRRSLYGTTGFIRSVSASYGSCATGPYGAAAVAWEDITGSTNTLGQSMMQYLDGHFALPMGTVLPIGITVDTRRPVVCLSQNQSLADIRTLVSVEASIAVGDTSIFGTGDTVLMNGTANISSTTLFVANGTSSETQAHIAYNNAADSFMVTYYNTDGASLAFVEIASANAHLNGAFVDTVLVDYRVSPVPLVDAFPRVDGIAQGSAFFTWNQNGVTYFEGQSVSPASVQNVSSNLAGMELYPNPATNNITLSFTAEEKDEVMLLITDISGKTVQSLPADINKGSNQVPVELSNLAAGNYIIRIAGSHTNTSMMFMVRH